MAVHKSIIQTLRYTKKITLWLYRYVCMYASYESSTAAHVSSNARSGAGRCSSTFLFNVVNDLYGVNHIGGAAGHFGRFAAHLGVPRHALGSLVLFVDFLQNVVDRRSGNQDVLLGEVDPRETVNTSFWTPAFFHSWSVLMGVVHLDHCQGDQNNFCLSSLSGWNLLYRTRAFASPHVG